MHRSSIGSTDCGAKLLSPGILTRFLILIQFERWPSEYVLLHQNFSGVSILWGRGKMAANVECRIGYHTGYISQLFKTSKPRHSRVGNNELNGPYLYLFLYFRSIFDACEMSQIFMKSFRYLSAIPCTLHLMLNFLFSPLFSSNVGQKMQDRSQQGSLSSFTVILLQAR